MVAAVIEVLVPVLGAVVLVVMVGMAGHLVWTGLTRGEIRMKHGAMSRAENPKGFRDLLILQTFVFVLLVSVLLYVVYLNVAPLLLH